MRNKSLSLCHEAVLTRIEAAAELYERQADSIQLLAVSKNQPIEAIREVAQCGQRRFGENYVQEAMPKIQTLAEEGLSLEWHFIGHIQSNKCGDIAKNFDWVQTVDRWKIAEKLSKHRAGSDSPLNICIQINIDEEPQKSGILPADTLEIAAIIGKLPNLKLRGVMAIPKVTDDLAEMRRSFHRLASIYRELQGKYEEVDTLSMGMSADLELAIAEGSTLVRVGTAIFIS